MRTNESVNRELKSTRRKLFYKMYMFPWMLLSLALFIGIGFLGYENYQLQKTNGVLAKKIRTPERILVRMYDPEIQALSKNKENTENEERREQLVSESQEDNERESEESKVEKPEVTIVEESKVENPVMARRGFTDDPIEFPEVDEELLELYMLKQGLDNEDLRVRSAADIRSDFSMIRSRGFTRENYNYAQELGVRVEVQVIKELEEILEKKFDEYDEIFISEKNKDLFLRDLKYEINEGVLNEFRIYWQMNKQK